MTQASFRRNNELIVVIITNKYFSYTLILAHLKLVFFFLSVAPYSGNSIFTTQVKVKYTIIMHEIC